MDVDKKKSNSFYNVSVVIPTKDRPIELERALRSVKTQGNVNVEIIVVENNSLNPLLVEEVALRFGARFFSLQGLANANTARNLGCDRARYDFVAFLDSDDVWDPDHLFKRVYLMDQDKLDFVYGGARIYDGETFKDMPARSLSNRENPIDYLLGWSRGYAQTSSFVIRKYCTKTVRWQENLKRNQDLQYFVDACSSLKSGYLEYITYTIYWISGEKRTLDIDSHKTFVLKNIRLFKFTVLFRTFLVMVRASLANGTVKDMCALISFYLRISMMKRSEIPLRNRD